MMPWTDGAPGSHSPEYFGISLFGISFVVCHNDRPASAFSTTTPPTVLDSCYRAEQQGRVRSIRMKPGSWFFPLEWRGSGLVPKWGVIGRV